MTSVYFIQCGDGGPIKIGYTDGDVERRRCNLQSGSPYPLALLGTMPGGAKKEVELHQQFANARFRGEWFWPVVELREFIAGLHRPPAPPSKILSFPDGNPMRKMRLEMGLTQAQLGELFGTKQSHISRLEMAPVLRSRTLLALEAIGSQIAAGSIKVAA